MKLFLVHCGFYDADVGAGIYESHVNFFVAAESADAARARARELPPFKERRMHVDGLQELTAVDGFRIHLEPDAALAGQSILTNVKHRDLAPKPAPSAESVAV